MTSGTFLRKLFEVSLHRNKGPLLEDRLQEETCVHQGRGMNGIPRGTTKQQEQEVVSPQRRGSVQGKIRGHTAASACSGQQPLLLVQVGSLGRAHPQLIPCDHKGSLLAGCFPNTQSQRTGGPRNCAQRHRYPFG